ncbi:MAG: hypothetical protein KDC48_12915 [Planctomycetes bacterium]|nr:hypothetical protein [Planctomycetota bacterium]
MNTRRILALSFLCSAVLAPAAVAQDFFAGGGVSDVFRVTPQGVFTQVTFGPGMVQPAGGVPFEIDQRFGHLIIADRAVSGGDIQIFRTVIAGTTAVQQTLLMTIPNTPGPVPYAGSIHRAGDGSFVLLSRGTSGVSHRLDRLGLTLQGGVSTQIPINNLGIFGTTGVTHVAVDNLGAIFMTGPNGSSGRIFRLDPAGGNVTLFNTSTRIDYFSLEVRPDGSLIAGGLPLTSSPFPANLACGITATSQGGLLQVGAGPAVSGVADLFVEEGGLAYMVLNNTGVSTIQSHNVAQCGLGNVIGSPNGVVLRRVARIDPQRRPEYGSSCITTAMMLGRNTELAPPILTLPWVIGLTNGLPNGGAVVSVGNSELAAPVSLGAFGAPDCSLFQSNEATSSLITLNAQGAAQFQLLVPPDPALVNSSLFAQWGVLTNANPFGIAMTNAIHSIIQ